MTAASPIEGLSYRRLDYWVRRGFLQPDNAAPGTGFSREWPGRELRIARLMLRLADAGLDLEVAHRVARNGDRVLAPGIRLVIDEEESDDATADG